MHLWKSIHLHLFFVFGVLSSKMLFSPPSVVRANVNGESLGDILLWIFIIILSVIYLSTSHLAFSLSAGITLDFEKKNQNQTWIYVVFKCWYWFYSWRTGFIILWNNSYCARTSTSKMDRIMVLILGFYFCMTNYFFTRSWIMFLVNI